MVCDAGVAEMQVNRLDQISMTYCVACDLYPAHPRMKSAWYCTSCDPTGTVGVPAHAATTARHTKVVTFDPADDHPGYRELEPWQIAPEVRRAAATMLAIATKDLGLAPVTLHWYEDDRGADRGFTCSTRPRAVWIRKRDAYQWLSVMRTVAHELKHLAQYRTGLKSSSGMLRDSVEAAAAAYATKMLQQFL
jgi:hypothetical protein